ncbi:hypothetical protein HDU67_003244 [Dinochytrium kinnereticum]|nr:hypothetical protein HDU67_003244 [Dinochytrium kinnereticum]
MDPGAAAAAAAAAASASGSMNTEQLQLLLDIMQESRRISEAEAKKKEETRKAMEIQYQMEKLRQDSFAMSQGGSPMAIAMASQQQHHQQQQLHHHHHHQHQQQQLAQLYSQPHPPTEYHHELSSAVRLSLPLDLPTLGSPTHARLSQASSMSIQHQQSMNFSPLGSTDSTTVNRPASDAAWIEDLLHTVEASGNLDNAAETEDYLTMDFGFLDKLVSNTTTPINSSANRSPNTLGSATPQSIHSRTMIPYLPSTYLNPLLVKDVIVPIAVEGLEL